MQRRELGRGGVSISAVGFGCMSFAGFYGPTDEATSLNALAKALDYGVDFWDTADVYGMGLSETYIGKFFKAEPGRARKGDAGDQILDPPHARRNARARQFARIYARSARRPR